MSSYSAAIDTPSDTRGASAVVKLIQHICNKRIGSNVRSFVFCKNYQTNQVLDLFQ